MNTPSGLQKVIEHFQQNGWKFQLEQDRPVLRTGFGGKNGAIRCIIVVDESDDLIQVIAPFPEVPGHRSAAAAELCLRASFGIKTGKFEFDHSDGDLRFQAASHYAKGELSDDLIRHLLELCLIMADAYLPAFMKVIYTDVSPAEAASEAHDWLARGGEPVPGPELQMPGRFSLN
ncbi:MAG TPA: YbjN domain-containing protein [Candidatus Paceibacterota bacterium]|nr:YbjN domain-containing protein [Verrucomicrobiota bacterium]HSA10902.1 YbjN domain-containing protein [Candidatus Paceibacterota bacterium]